MYALFWSVARAESQKLVTKVFIEDGLGNYRAGAIPLANEKHCRNAFVHFGVSVNQEGLAAKDPCNALMSYMAFCNALSSPN